MRHLVAIQHGLHGKFYIAFVANESADGHFVRQGVRAAIDITVDSFPIAQSILGLLDFDNGQRRWIKYTRFFSFRIAV